MYVGMCNAHHDQKRFAYRFNQRPLGIIASSQKTFLVAPFARPGIAHGRGGFLQGVPPRSSGAVSRGHFRASSGLLQG